MSIFDSYDVIRIISLPARTDRRRDMDKQLARVGLAGDPRVSYYDAHRMTEPGHFSSVGAHGCFLSHLGVLEEAKGRRLMLLEDDCNFTDEARRQSVPADCDIFYGGYDRVRPDDPNSDDIIGAHCMGFSARAVTLGADYLRTFLGDDFVPEPRALAEGGYDGKIRPPADGAYVWLRRLHPELTAVFAEPKAAVQRPSRTDIAETRLFDRIPVVRTLANFARRLR